MKTVQFYEVVIDKDTVRQLLIRYALQQRALEQSEPVDIGWPPTVIYDPTAKSYTVYIKERASGEVG